jgi:hypothetical protein
MINGIILMLLPNEINGLNIPAAISGTSLIPFYLTQMETKRVVIKFRG